MTARIPEKPIDLSQEQTRLISQIKKKQELAAAKVHAIYEALAKFQGMFQAHPKLQASEFSIASANLQWIKGQTEKLGAEDFGPVSKDESLAAIEQFRVSLAHLDPNAWKIDLLARGIIVGCLSTWLGWYHGWLGVKDTLFSALIYFGVQRVFSV